MNAAAATDYDLVVIGIGPAGEKAAVQAAYFGKRVAAIECASEPGGAGTHTGTLPSKTLRETAMYLSGYRSRDMYGVAVELEPAATLQRLMSRKAEIAESESRRIRANLERHGVTYLQGFGRFAGTNMVDIFSKAGTRRVAAAVILVATGSRPSNPKEFDFNDARIHDSDEILTIEHIPGSMVILGGGVIGCEYACMFAALGVKVTLVDAREALLTFLDQELVEQLVVSMRRMGVELRLGSGWTGAKRVGDQVTVTLRNRQTIVAEDLLYAAGREGRTRELNLESVGVVPDARGYIPVNAKYQTSAPGILAVGDAIGFPALAATSMEQGRVAICHAFGFEYKQAMAELLPYGIYTIPEMSSIGETEASAGTRGIECVIGRAPYSENARGKIAGDTEGLLKLVVARGTRRLIGVHVIGERATELVHIGQAVMHMNGAIDAFIDMVFNFPSLAEAYKYAAYDCLRQLHREA